MSTQPKSKNHIPDAMYRYLGVEPGGVLDYVPQMSGDGQPYIIVRDPAWSTRQQKENGREMTLVEAKVGRPDLTLLDRLKDSVRDTSPVLRSQKRDVCVGDVPGLSDFYKARYWGNDNVIERQTRLVDVHSDLLREGLRSTYGPLGKSRAELLAVIEQLREKYVKD